MYYKKDILNNIHRDKLNKKIYVVIFDQYVKKVTKVEFFKKRKTVSNEVNIIATKRNNTGTSERN
jgi:hypothetical protein